MGAEEAEGSQHNSGQEKIGGYDAISRRNRTYRGGRRDRTWVRWMRARKAGCTVSGNEEDCQQRDDSEPKSASAQAYEIEKQEEAVRQSAT